MVLQKDIFLPVAKLRQSELTLILTLLIVFLVQPLFHYHSPAYAESDNPAQTGTPSISIEKNLPHFYSSAKDRITFPLSWLSGNYSDFDSWKAAAKEKVRETMLSLPPDVPFDAIVIAEEDRGSYTARKILFNVTADSRISAYMLIPKGAGPHPAVLLLHDHGARFDIGKEKVIRPIDDPEKLKSAEEWVNECYGGRFIGDELAKQGYICFATDMLNWSERGGGGYEGQQAIASNLMYMGMSFAGIIVHEDLRAAEFLSLQPEVNTKRIAAMGLSVGGHRTWRVTAMSDHIAAGVSICWMTTIKAQISPGINITRGNSAYTMLHPGLYNYLDYPDIASIACPKPLLVYNGLKDGLFPVPSVKDAYRKMRSVWTSQNAGDKLETKLWDVPHEFNREMQIEAFAWLHEMFEKIR